MTVNSNPESVDFKKRDIQEKGKLAHLPRDRQALVKSLASVNKSDKLGEK